MLAVRGMETANGPGAPFLSMPKSRIQLRELALAPSAPSTSAQLLIYGDIGSSWDGRSVEAADVVRHLSELPDTVVHIEVRINSYGGSVADGLAIYNALLQHPAKVTVYIDGIAASIASVIAMAGDDIKMPRASLLMIHAPWSGIVGNASDMRENADVLDKFADAMAEAYATKTGELASDFISLMGDGLDHWFDAEEALAEGLIDEIYEAGAPADAEASAFAHALLSRAPRHIAAALRRFHSNHSENPAMPRATPSARRQPALQLSADDAARTPSVEARLQAEAKDRNERMTLARTVLHQWGDDPNVRASVTSLLDGLMTVEDFRDSVWARLGEGVTPCSAAHRETDSTRMRASGPLGPQGDDFMVAAGDALLARAGVRVPNAHPAAGDFRHTSVVELARASLSRYGRSVHQSESPEAIIRAALSTSDFPLILENSLNKAIRLGMETPSLTHRTWCRLTEARDFKPQSRVLLGTAPDLKRVHEGAEYEYGVLGEDRASLTPGKYGRIVKVTYEALVNDDLGAFLAIGPSLGFSALRAESDILYGLLIESGLDGVVMQDTKRLFHADHNNTVSAVTGTGKPLTAAALSAARSKLRRQASPAGTLLNLAPKYLLVPPERESEAEILVASSTVSTSQAGAQAQPGWMAKLTVVAEARLANTDTIYLVADGALIDTGEVAALPSSPELLTEDSFNVDARQWKLRHSFACGFLDHRGIVKLTLTAA